MVVEDQEKRKQIVATIHDSSYLGIDRTMDLVTSMQLQWMSSKLKKLTHTLYKQKSYKGL